jgi:hypothetical protein
MRLISRFLSLIALAGAAAIANPTAAASAAVNCGSQLSTLVAATSNHSTSSKGFVNLLGGGVNFNGGGNKCVVVTFSAPMRAVFPQAVRVRATLDAQVGIQASTDFHTAEAAFDGKSATFYFPAVTTGNHIVRMQFLSVNGGNVTIAKGLLTIWYDLDLI